MARRNEKIPGVVTEQELMSLFKCKQLGTLMRKLDESGIPYIRNRTVLFTTEAALNKVLLGSASPNTNDFDFIFD